MSCSATDEGSEAGSKNFGRALKRVFGQQDILKGIEEQKAVISFLMNEKRRALFSHLCQHPCDHLRGIARALDISATGASWHLRTLVDAGYVEHAEIKARKVFWPKGMVLKRDIGLVACLRRPYPLKMLVIISKRGPARENLLVSELGESQQRVNHWLDWLVGVGLLARKGKARQTRYVISDKLLKKVGGYETRAIPQSERLLSLLEKDGLMPRKPFFRGTKLSVEIKLPAGKQRIRLECDPFAEVASIIK